MRIQVRDADRLIVEDNQALADAVAEVLRTIGYRTSIVQDGEAALSEVERSVAGGSHRRS